MKKSILVAILPFLVTTAGAAENMAMDDIMASKTEDAKAAMKQLGGSLKAELQTAIKDGGPTNAISVCNKRAPEIASQVSSEKDLQIGRVSLLNRNPSNAAEGWKKAVLEDFETRKAAGESPDKLVFREIAEVDGGKEFRMMKAIPAAKICLTCHGTNLDPALAAEIDSLYPGDKATGYSEGDLRGAFWVTSKL
jgi:hypothetical protein